MQKTATMKPIPLSSHRRIKTRPQHTRINPRIHTQNPSINSSQLPKTKTNKPTNPLACPFSSLVESLCQCDVAKFNPLLSLLWMWVLEQTTESVAEKQRRSFLRQAASESRAAWSAATKLIDVWHKMTGLSNCVTWANRRAHSDRI